MSKSLENQVWQSALDPELKPVAAVMADMGNNDGLGIYPSVEYIAWLLSRSERSVQSALKKLVQLGVLDRVANATGGRGLTPRYKLSAEKLPERTPWKDLRKGATVAPFSEGKGATNGKKGAEFSEKGANSAPDPLVDPLDQNRSIRARGYKADPKPVEIKTIYPPEDFAITNELKVWLAENFITFTESDLKEATKAWEESRHSDPSSRGRTLEQWQYDWRKFIRIYWNLRQRNGHNGNGKPADDYRGPGRDTESAEARQKRLSCPACHGVGTILLTVKGVECAKPCNHEVAASAT